MQRLIDTLKGGLEALEMVRKKADSQAEVYGLRSGEETETGADFEILLRNPQRMEAMPFKFISRGRIAKVGGPLSGK